MNTHRTFEPSRDVAYLDADGFLGKRESRKIQNHTYLRRRDSTIAVMFHATDVVTYNRDGSISLDTGGYWTVSTKERICTYNPMGYVRIDHGEWIYHNSQYTKGDRFYEFKDGMLIQPINGVPDTDRWELKVLEHLTGKSFTEPEVTQYIASLELSRVKQLIKNKYLQYFVVEHCRKEFLPAFLNNEKLVSIVEGRLRNEKDSR